MLILPGWHIVIRYMNQFGEAESNISKSPVQVDEIGVGAKDTFLRLLERGSFKIKG